MNNQSFHLMLLLSINSALSASPPVTNGAVWQHINTALRKGVNIAFYFTDGMAAFRCPSDPWTLSDNLCAIAMNIATTNAQIVYIILDNVRLRIMSLMKFVP